MQSHYVADYCMEIGAQCAFVTTNSICQGEQVNLLWPILYKRNVEVGFAHQSFKWKNNAAKPAGVTCIVVGIRNIQKSRKILYSDKFARIVSNINPYLIEGENVVVHPISNSKTRYPIMKFGNKPVDGGNLILSKQQKERLLEEHPEARILIRRLYGSQEFIKGIERHCLWIEDANLKLAKSIPEILKRINQTKLARSKSIDEGANSLIERPHQFREMYAPREYSIIVPAVSSEGREVLPCGVIGLDSVINNRNFQILDGPMWVFSIIVSRMHYIWADTVGGKLESRFNYSNTLVYNTFPIPEFSETQKQNLEDHAVEILGAREAHPGKSIAWLYNPKTMPANLSKAHRDLDETLERIYIGRPFKDDSERLEHLFKLYAQMTKKAEPAKKAG